MTIESQTDAQDARETDAVPEPQATESKAESPRVTRPLPAIDANGAAQATAPAAPAIPSAAAAPAEPQEADLDATLNQRVVRPEANSRPRKATLAMAITRPEAKEKDVAPPSPAPSASQPRQRPTPPVAARQHQQPAPVAPNAVPDDVEDEVDEWGVADQPTVYLPPRSLRRARPGGREMDSGFEQELDEAVTQLRRPVPPPAAPVRFGPPPAAPVRPSPASGPTFPRRDPAQRISSPNAPGQPRLAAPDGRPMPGTPPQGVPPAALPDPRAQRFQELRRQRLNHEEGERDPDDERPVAEVVRQWWNDLRPGLRRALDYQHEAQESGVHPIPAYEEPPTGLARLGDAFGRLTASARNLTGRAQAAAGPTIKRLQDSAGRLHNQAEQAAQALVGRIEGPAERQQAPLLGPGRVAIFFRQGVTVGQAQSLLAASGARPIRLIPRKHGFLARVAPGLEGEISERLRIHPYVRDVAYMEYDENGEPAAQG